jgi:uncharacterized membrane protein
MGSLLKTAAEYIAYTAEAVAALIIVIGVVQAVWIYFARALPARCRHREMLLVRARLGHALSLGLEFLIAADILKTAVAPSWDDIGQLAAIIGIRTVLNLFLTREIKLEEEEIAAIE